MRLLRPCISRPRILRFRVRRLSPVRLSVLRLGIVARPGILGLRVLGLQVPSRNCVVDLVVLVLVLGNLTGTLGSDIDPGEVDNVRGLIRNVTFVLHLAGPLIRTLRGRPRVALLGLFLFVYAIDATASVNVTRPTPERHLNNIRVVIDFRVGVSDVLNLTGADGVVVLLLKPSALLSRSRVDRFIDSRLIDSRLIDSRLIDGRLVDRRPFDSSRLLGSRRTVATLRALRSPLLNLPLKSDSGDAHGGATLQIPVPGVLLLALVRRVCNGSRGHRRSPRSLKTAPYREVGQSSGTTGVSGRRPGRRIGRTPPRLEAIPHRQPGDSRRTTDSRRTLGTRRALHSRGTLGSRRSLTRTRFLRRRRNGRRGRRQRRGGVRRNRRKRRNRSNRRRRRLFRTARRILRIPGRRRVIDGELARRLDGGLCVGLVIAGCGPAPADPVPIAVHNSSWCGRAPSCRTGATVLVVRGRLIRPALPL
ncbi:hypothetical protein G6048_39380 [Streptomyces sp. YC419]|uniref:Uncharacterized protein n=1 Tax=Streptomyces ureilyticus TaxID=1775131 RepID=A0ABX0E5R4_9ACTN|nr:hypothetical protein [Streptomyces ureilyticus]